MTDPKIMMCAEFASLNQSRTFKDTIYISRPGTQLYITTFNIFFTPVFAEFIYRGSEAWIDE
jgi:hypothetical protein